MIRFGPASSPPQVWAVEDTRLQLAWGNLPAGPVTARACDAEVVIDHRGGPGALDLDHLPADRAITVELLWDGGSTSLRTRTLPTPPGALLSRFATISDMHLGAVRWGALKTMRDTSGHPVPHPYRCAEAAIAEAVAWGAELLLIKGDTAQHESDRDFEELARLVDAFPDLPMMLIPGNHDVDGRSGTIPLTVGQRAVPFVRRVDHLDIAGARLVVADTTVPGRGWGTLARVCDGVVERAASADRPVFVAIHQQLQPTRLPRQWPIGIAAPASTDFLSRLDQLSRPVTVTSGHTHRNRSRTHGDVLVTEVGSTKDWPGVWADYAVHEGGIRQVVRRIAAPAAISWTEYSRGALRGLWGMWSPGRLDERCISHAWVRDSSYASGQ